MHPGSFKGNPSLSVTVSQYMVSLRRRKVRQGEVVTSARAIDEETIKVLYYFNNGYPPPDGLDGLTSRKRKAEHPEDWAGYTIRMMLQVLYITSMLCLLRYDEALGISWSDVFFERAEDGSWHRLRLELPVRKTHQNGGISPFYLYPNKERPWMCPIRAWATWWTIVRVASGNTIPQGYVFRKKMGTDKFSILPGDAMSSDSFLECFRSNLLDVRIDPRPYGTHSFRRGGCQYLAITLRWPLRDICSWAGWAENFDNPGTLFKYLLSWNDAPRVQREDYFNPKRAAEKRCSVCGRSCHCA
ncbi:hypothetical protein GLOTRDRAFT_105114 [Gloeophyllum trabeum ATCC 11539]|uniref:DNA breaking-rejoining enzyme n=1 Tax=Gloeophyllum trabeum (strain ATCC 11539 / FP-39264 / Madison 617) TaxID=670483 RepID=S7Q7W9_GLOTA|nr:uncharacterized protein GLOTRDRAFT_105114 [Gloeophyllum trabeum ATCC 11539]EPQ56081.1 hypothetical protein GLOTRDRAFT_105114 [Gloeophyllum trabeum ATCC 11539]